MEQENFRIYSGTYCALGVALPMAIGARIGAPGRPVVVWNNKALKEIAYQMDHRGIPPVSPGFTQPLKP